MSNEPVATGEQKVSTSTTTAQEECESVDPEFYSESQEYLLEFSNGRDFKMPLTQGVYK